MSDVSLLSGISGLSFDSHFLSSLSLSFLFCLVLLLFLSGLFSANGPFSCLFFFFFYRKLNNNKTIAKGYNRPFRMALVEQLGDDSL